MNIILEALRTLNEKQELKYSFAVCPAGDDPEEVLKHFKALDKAIAYAKKQSFPTQIIYWCDGDPDDYGYPETPDGYDPFEVVWESDPGLGFGSEKEKREVTLFGVKVNPETLTSFTIPDSATKIDWWAFRYCQSLESVVIPNSVTSIDDYAFCECQALKSITIPESVTSIGKEAFQDCTALKSVIIPDSVTLIGYGAFLQCESLESVTIPNSIISIDDHTFMNCFSLSSVSIPNSVTSIGFFAFCNCESLTEITYLGTKAEWEKIEKDRFWNDGSKITTIHCIDGDIEL